MAAHRIPYAATASVAFPEDMIRKFQKAKHLKGGSRFIHVFAPCPTGWRIPSEMTIKIARLAVQTNLFPLYEVEDGTTYTLNYQGNLPVRAYLKPQGRFKHLMDADMEQIQELVNDDWNLLMQKVGHPSSFSKLKALSLP
jgi:pyruvate/2-oxoacid:ferredoxin oxidoreductase beta subunit